LLLRVVPGREPSFWYPGALLEEKDDAILVGLVRCPIDVECPVDVVATWHPTHSIVTPVTYNLTLPNTDKPIKLDYPSGAVRIWPRGAEEKSREWNF